MKMSDKHLPTNHLDELNSAQEVLYPPDYRKADAILYKGKTEENNQEKTRE
ncbi:hypothetical protein PP175_11985 [Aneurinibacillus sp. Ricciae_BoGa-3]|uniref:hypothetical protein n=1 Tax=Aneurinibacillus sp. Ricciae_BoGa-3 TaxID=3022697 RepID=UPI0023424F48|nr:hypothetical protein [Aneurinibacillus sp. Ricciae_BoGa-3]WCK56564.1 hypothetical protein PP175_11985 [Aneurinibacillus sp. Ricciae_BoGa-3]